MATRFVDLSHTIEDGMGVLPGLPSPQIGAHLTHEASRDKYDDAEFFLGKVDMPANVGTYIDSPFHRFKDREDLSRIPLEHLVGLPGLVLDCSEASTRELHPELPDRDLDGVALLVRTGWDQKWATDTYFGPAPYLAEAFATELIERRVGLVGVDTWNVDDTTTRRRPIHTGLLDAGIYIVEHLRGLDGLPARGFRFFAPVISLRGGASFAVRAFAELEGGEVD